MFVEKLIRFKNALKGLEEEVLTTDHPSIGLQPQCGHFPSLGPLSRVYCTHGDPEDQEGTWGRSGNQPWST